MVMVVEPMLALLWMMMSLHEPMKKMSWKPFAHDVEFGEAHNALLACVHDEPLHVPMKMIYGDALGGHVGLDGTLRW